MQLLLTRLAPVGLALLASCSDEQTLREVSGPDISPRLVAGTTTNLLPANIRPEEAVFAALSERIPSSAGYYLDSDGNTVVPVRDSTEFQAAKQAFAAVQPSNHREYARGGVRVIKAQYSFGQLAKTRDALFDNVFNVIAGITSLDLDEVHNRVVIGVDIASAEKTTVIVRAAISKLSIDQNAVEVRSEKAMAWTSAAADLSRTSVSAYLPPTLPNLLVDAWPTLAGGILILTSATDPRTEAAGGPGGCSLGFTPITPRPPAVATAPSSLRRIARRAGVRPITRPLHKEQFLAGQQQLTPIGMVAVSIGAERVMQPCFSWMPICRTSLG